MTTRQQRLSREQINIKGEVTYIINARQNIQKRVEAGILHESEATPQGRVFVARDILPAVAETT